TQRNNTKPGNTTQSQKPTRTVPRSQPHQRNPATQSSTQSTTMQREKQTRDHTNHTTNESRYKETNRATIARRNHSQTSTKRGKPGEEQPPHHSWYRKAQKPEHKNTLQHRGRS